MVVVTLIKKDFKLAIKSPCTSLLNFLLIPVLSLSFFLTAYINLAVTGPTEPKILDPLSEIQFGLIGEKKYREKAKQIGLLPYSNFDSREDFWKFLEEIDLYAIKTNYIEIVEKNDRREYNFILVKNFKPPLNELNNWFSIEENKSLSEYSEPYASDLAAIAVKIENKILEDEANFGKVSITFLQGANSSLFKGDFVQISPLFIIFYISLCFLLLFRALLRKGKIKAIICF